MQTRHMDKVGVESDRGSATRSSFANSIAFWKLHVFGESQRSVRRFGGRFGLRVKLTEIDKD